MQLLQTLAGDVLAQSVHNILLGEEHVYSLERSIVRRHAVILQTGDGLHALLVHILLCQHDGQLLSTVVAVVEEDYNITFLDGAVNGGIVNGLDELVGNAFVVAFLHSLHHIGSLLAFTGDEQVVSHLHAVPALVAVHCIEATDNACDGGVCALDVVGQLLYETLTRAGVCITTVHEAMHESLLDAVLLRNVAQGKQMVER